MLNVKAIGYKSCTPSCRTTNFKRNSLRGSDRRISLFYPEELTQVSPLLRLKMHFVLFELAVVLPFCIGQVMDEASSQDIEESQFSNKGPKRHLRPTLNIKYGPSRMMSIMAGESKHLECEAGGNPPPTIHWMKNGRKIHQSFYEALLEEESSKSVLPSKLGLGVTKSRLYIDCPDSMASGKYTCVAENEILREGKSGRVFVADHSGADNPVICSGNTIDDEHVRIYMWTHTRLETMGSDVQLFCRAEGHPQPTVEWTGPDGVSLKSSRYQVLDNGDLIIRNIQWSDMGGYTCRASNRAAYDEIVAFLYPTLADNHRKAKE